MRKRLDEVPCCSCRTEHREPALRSACSACMLCTHSTRCGDCESRLQPDCARSCGLTDANISGVRGSSSNEELCTTTLKPLGTAQNQNRSESELQTDSKPRVTRVQVNLESGHFVQPIYSRFCLRSRDQHSNICSNICRSGCQHVNINICNEPFPHFDTSLVVTDQDLDFDNH